MKTTKASLIIVSILFLLACGKKSNPSTNNSSTSNENQQSVVINKNALIGYWVIPQGDDKLKYPALSIDPMGTMTSFNMEPAYDHWNLVEPNTLMLMSEKGKSANYDVISVDSEKLVLKDAAGKTITYEMDIPPAERM